MKSESKVLVLTDVNGRSELLRALRESAETLGMTEVSKVTGIPRTHLYSILSEAGNPTLASLLSLAGALGFTIHVAPKK